MIKPACLIAVSVCLLSACTSAAVEKPPALLSEADSLISNGVIEYNQANYAKAATLFEKASYRYRSIDEPRGSASAYLNLAKTAISRHQLAQARHYLDAAQAIVDREYLTDLQHHIIITASSIAIEAGDFTKAKSLLDTILNSPSVDDATAIAAMQNRTRIAFAEHDGAVEWTQRFAGLVNHKPINKARLERFRAALATDSATQDKHYSSALNIYRSLAYRPGLAATLTEWAEHNIKSQNFAAAQNRLERALLIRLDLRDNHNSVEVLKQLEATYRALNAPVRQQLAARWQTQVSKDNFSDWNTVLNDFETTSYQVQKPE